ncbi:ABC transporter ATP-binding protein [Moorella sulfitireducens]|uniref:ABC transporter ATP-binding protein n=1 Tax=Neomoorella sulfitireducens TaxID=2972948 RepID=UPI0021ACA8F9|nr:ABC transporter ATP-binding protein [Moorella sulfitireducens]
MIMQVDGVEFSYNGRHVLRNIKFSIAAGEFLAILGNNGAGKSTLIKCLNKILKPKRGTVLIDKENVFHLSRLDVARKIGYVAQRSEGGRVTVFDAVLLGRKPHIKWDVSANDLEIVQRVLALLDLEVLSLRYLDELSGGELQKVVIARALAQEPRVLLLDEPTSNLDLRNQLEVLQTVKTAAREHNLAAVVVMHDLNMALRFADKFLFLKNHTIFACGGLEIMTPENIAGVYGVPVTMATVQSIPVIVPLA